jgi:hypothetical protein
MPKLIIDTPEFRRYLITKLREIFAKYNRHISEDEWRHRSEFFSFISDLWSNEIYTSTELQNYLIFQLVNSKQDGLIHHESNYVTLAFFDLPEKPHLTYQFNPQYLKTRKEIKLLQIPDEIQKIPDEIQKISDEIQKIPDENRARGKAITLLKLAARRLPIINTIEAHSKDQVARKLKACQLLSEDLAAFKALDLIAAIPKQYTNRKNTARTEKINELKKAICSAYQGSFPLVAVNSLITKLEAIKDQVQKDHKAHGALSFFGKYQPNSKLVTCIDRVMQTIKQADSVLLGDDGLGSHRVTME